jgi:hypothetical protein
MVHHPLAIVNSSRLPDWKGKVNFARAGRLDSHKWKVLPFHGKIRSDQDNGGLAGNPRKVKI